MKHVLEVCLVALTLATNVTPSASAQSAAMQRGVSVQLAVTNNATPMPEADNEDAWIVTVTAEGAIYFGTDPVAAASLADEMKSRPRKREQKLCIKADARSPFANVERVLEAGRGVGFEAAVLLTAQPGTPESGTVVLPNGLEVLISPTLPAAAVATVVQLLNPEHQGPLLRVNGDEIPWSALEGTLRRHFQKGDEKVILLKADEQLPFGQVVQAIDTCRATGAKVVLPTPQL
jgi:biopolymer transport protein ExbD